MKIKWYRNPRLHKCMMHLRLPPIPANGTIPLFTLTVETELEEVHLLKCSRKLSTNFKNNYIAHRWVRAFLALLELQLVSAERNFHAGVFKRRTSLVRRWIYCTSFSFRAAGKPQTLFERLTKSTIHIKFRNIIHFKIYG